MNVKAVKSNEIQLNQSTDVFLLRQEASSAARAVDMTDLEQEVVRIVATELGTNVIKHAGAGSATVERDTEGKAITITTRNPSGHLDAERVFEDGRSTAGTLGIGLGAVRRLCDDVQLLVENGEFIVHARKRHTEDVPSFIETSVQSRPLPGFQENGDGYYVNARSDSAVLAVIDGLGHGQQAAEATQKALSVIAADDRAPLVEIVQRMHVALHRTRGCVIGIAHMAPDGKTEYVGVGNIRAHIFSSTSGARSLLSYSGVVGGNMRTVRAMSYIIPPRGTLIVYSDGVKHLTPSNRLLSGSVRDVSSRLFQENAKPNDDATLLIARMK